MKDLENHALKKINTLERRLLKKLLKEQQRMFREHQNERQAEQKPYDVRTDYEQDVQKAIALISRQRG